MAFVSKLATHARGRLRSLAAKRHNLGTRLLGNVLLFSACVTLVLTLLQLYLEFRQDVSALELRLEQIGESNLDSLAERLWALDENQLRLQLQGILRLPDMRAADVRSAEGVGGPFVVALGEKSQSSAIRREYPLHYNVQGQDMVIGTLVVEASLADIYRRLINTALTLLLSQAAKTFLVSLFILYIFHYLVTRHLFAIASFVGSYRIHDPPPPLRLRRPPRPEEDELQRVVTAFNALSDNLRVTYRNLQDANHQLARDVAARREAEAVLREREARIRRLIDANIVGIFIWDFQGWILEANDAFLDMVGYDREDLVAGRVRWTDLTPPEWRDRDISLMQEQKVTGRLQPFEKEYFRKDGSRLPVLIGAATFEEGGNQGVAFVLDLSDRKRAEEALRDSEEQWRAVFENNPTMYFMVDATGIILSVNPLGAEQLGYRADELIGCPVENLFLEADREAVQRNTAICFERLGGAMSWELRKVRKDGDVLWVRETARAMLIKKRPIVLIVCEDITERKRAEYLTGQVFESSPDGISIVGRDYRYQRANPTYERNWGLPAGRIVGKHVADLLGTHAFELTIKPYLDRCFEGEDVSFAEWFNNPLGRRYLAVTYTPLRPGSDRVEAALVVTRDLTDYTLASEALRAAQAELAHANRIATMGQLTASIAHEVNQPIAAMLTSAQGALRWLATDPPDLAEVRQALERIARNSTRAGDVIDRMRALIKKAPPLKESLDINEALGEVILLTRSEAAKNGVLMHTQLAEGLPTIQGDRVQLQQVILNLIVNAIEAMSEAKEGSRELQIGTGRDANSVLVSVRDSGPGLAPDMLEHVFEAFYTTKRRGLGVGLSICRSIIEAHGGRLWASANVGRGATFQFTLPAQAVSSDSATHPIDPALSGSSASS